MQKTYFVSDFHLGAQGRLDSRERERQIVRWLDEIRANAGELYLVGDVFDYWFEYDRAVPKGFVRLLGKLAELRDGGLPIYFFTGNHDMWMFRYLDEELGIPIYRQPVVRQINGKRFFIGHGDGLGPGDYGYKFIKAVFGHPFNQWLFARLHPNFGLWLMRYFSGSSRQSRPPLGNFKGENGERLVQFCNDRLDKEYFDYFVFGHRHLPIDYTLKNGKSRYINLGEWLHFNSYAVFDGENMEVKFFENDSATVFGK
ncbi:MAG TPA: UDP-2,3-diacylglucosamine diphosphatase [Bacteroidetes bacterium]|nr:UDP-2,3-diacylglucosamine diphosphatase [Bacteroidota bacterium]